MGILTFILSNKKLIGIAIIAIAIFSTLIYVKSLKSDIEVLEAEKASLILKLEVSNASIAALQKSIDEQNAAVEKFKADADAREKAGIAAVARAKAESAVSKKKAETIITAKIPEGKTVCEAADDLFNQEIKK